MWLVRVSCTAIRKGLRTEIEGEKGEHAQVG
jgi:hypothetical protein